MRSVIWCTLAFLLVACALAHQDGQCTTTQSHTGSCSAHSHQHQHQDSHSHEHDHGHGDSHAHGHSHAHTHAHAHSHSHSHGHAHSHHHDSETCTSQSASLKCTIRNLALPLLTATTSLSSRLTTSQAALLSSFLTGVLSTVLVSLLPLHSTGSLSFLLQPFAAGALLADCAQHLLTEALAVPNGASYFLLALLGMYVLDVATRALGHSHTHAHSHSAAHTQAAVLNLAADAVHNFVDGLAIGAAFGVSRSAGLTTAAAVLAHELPQEAADYAVLLRAGWGRPKAVAANVACASVALAGTAAAIKLEAAAGVRAREILLPVAAAALMYLALASVVPDVVADTTGSQELAHGTKKLSYVRVLMRTIASSAAAAVGVGVVGLVEQLAH